MTHQSVHRTPLYKYSFCSVSNTLSSWCQYEALKFVSFPTQVCYICLNLSQSDGDIQFHNSSGSGQKRQGHSRHVNGQIGIASAVQKLRVCNRCANFSWNDCLFIGIRRG